jgi:uncharacterized damage-inducible protein DinB
MTTSTDPGPGRPLGPEELVSTAGEREAMEGFLEYYRALIPAKARGLSEQDLRRRLVPTATTLAGLLKHLASVERGWFQRRLAGLDDAAIGADTGGGPSSWVVGEWETFDQLAAELDEACARSREIAAGLDLTDSVPSPRLGRVSLRWIYLHMIEEYARHAGHADILREQIDGATGG